MRERRRGSRPSRGWRGHSLPGPPVDRATERKEPEPSKRWPSFSTFARTEWQPPWACSITRRHRQRAQRTYIGVSNGYQDVPTSRKPRPKSPNRERDIENVILRKVTDHGT